MPNNPIDYGWLNSTLTAGSTFSVDPAVAYVNILQTKPKKLRPTESPPDGLIGCPGCFAMVELKACVKIIDRPYCPACTKKFLTCARCGTFFPPEQFTKETHLSRDCPGCGTGTRSRLHVKQADFHPTSAVLHKRKETVWQPILTGMTGTEPDSGSEQTPKP